jgi:hypothetical protein
LTGKIELIGFGYMFRFLPILKYEDGVGNGDIDTHPEPVDMAGHF